MHCGKTWLFASLLVPQDVFIRETPYSLNKQRIRAAWSTGHRVLFSPVRNSLSVACKSLLPFIHPFIHEPRRLDTKPVKRENTLHALVARFGWAVHARPLPFLFYLGPVKGEKYQDFTSHKWIVWRKITHYQTHFYKKINLLRQMIEKHFVLFMLYRNYHRFSEKRENDCLKFANGLY